MNPEHHDIEEFLLSKPFQVKATDDAGAFEGYGAVFNDIHPTSSWMLGPEWKDRILPGAFTKTIAAYAKAGTMPAMLYMHERGNVVGAWRGMAEAKGGLEMSGHAAEGARVPNGASVRELLKMGALSGLSIGFRVTKETRDQEKKIRDIHEVEIGEVSLVDVPGIHRARVTDVKSGARTIEHLERALRDAGLSRREAKALLAEGFSALRDAGRDEEGDLAAAMKRLAQTIHP